MTRQIRSRLAGLRLPQHTLAAMLGISQTKLNLILNEHRRPPAGFEAEATAALDRLERAERAAARARARVLGGAAVSGRRERGAAADALPEVLFMDDVAALLRCSPSTIKRRLRARVFPVAPLPGIDKRPRWSKAALLEWLAAGGSGRAVRGRGRRTW